MLIDTHAHVNFNAYKDDIDEVIRRASNNNIWMINIGSQYDTSKRAAEIAEKYEKGVYATVGLHPIHLGPQKFIDEEEVKFKTREEKFDYEKYKDLALNQKVVAIGETGLDYYHVEDEKIRELQKEVFIKHLALAKELNKPIIFHCRKAYDELLEILKTHHPASLASLRSGPAGGSSLKTRGVLHCFMGKWSQAEEFLKLGFYLGFDGPITYCRDYDKVIKNCPFERILVETDSPYLTPEPFRGQRNEPLYVKYVAQKIAEIKEVSFEKVAEQTTENARELFGI